MSGDWEELTIQTARILHEVRPSRDPLATVNLYTAYRFGIISQDDVKRLLKERESSDDR